MKRPRVAILHYSAPPVVGGVEAVILAHAQIFVQAGYPVTVVAGQGAAEALPEGADLVLVPEIDSQHAEIARMSIQLEQGEVPDGFEAMTEYLSMICIGCGSLQSIDDKFLQTCNILTKRFFTIDYCSFLALFNKTF